jgi:hypothetical protein
MAARTPPQQVAARPASHREIDSLSGEDESGHDAQQRDLALGKLALGLA